MTIFTINPKNETILDTNTSRLIKFKGKIEINDHLPVTGVEFSSA